LILGLSKTKLFIRETTAFRGMENQGKAEDFKRFFSRFEKSGMLSMLSLSWWSRDMVATVTVAMATCVYVVRRNSPLSYLSLCSSLQFHLSLNFSSRLQAMATVIMLSI